ncbi:MAG: hypothetical protein GY806_05090 [Gammaproteobacteria bacterium]|nr:hypothetical protein [Gammaproteobacteria bacterium]
MSEASYSLMLRNLSNDFYHNHIGIDEYRAQRKVILDKIDKELNDQDPAKPGSENEQLSTVFMQTVSFFNNTEIDK